jgi:hypothetical protein
MSYKNIERVNFGGGVCLCLCGRDDVIEVCAVGR